MLQSFRSELNQESANFIEIVLVPASGGKDEAETLELLQTLGGLMLPPEELHSIEVLKEKFLVQELPAFVVLDRFGAEVSRDGLLDVKKYSKQQVLAKWSETFKKDQS